MSVFRSTLCGAERVSGLLLRRQGLQAAVQAWSVWLPNQTAYTGLSAGALQQSSCRPRSSSMLSSRPLSLPCAEPTPATACNCAAAAEVALAEEEQIEREMAFDQARVVELLERAGG